MPGTTTGKISAPSGGGGSIQTKVIEETVKAAVDFEVSSVKLAAVQQQYVASLTTLLHGNKEQAEKLSGTISDFAGHNSSFSLKQTQDAAKQLLTHGTQPNQVGGELQMLGDIATGSGSSINDVARIYSGAKATGSLSSKDAAVLEEKNIPITEALAQQYGITTDKVNELINAGKIGFPEMQQALQGMTQAGGSFYEAMENQNGTLLGKWDRLKKFGEEIKTSFGGWQVDVATSILGGKKTNANKDEAGFYVGAVTDALAANDTTSAIAKSNEISRKITADKNFLNSSHLQAGDKDENGRTISEVRAHFAALVAGSQSITQKFKAYNNGKAFLKTIPSSSNQTLPSGAVTNTGSAQTGSPQIIIYGGVAPKMIINSVDGGIPTKDIKEKVGRALLDLLNDSNLTNKQ